VNGIHHVIAEANEIQCSPLIHKSSHFITKGEQAGQVQFAFGNARPKALIHRLQVPRNVLQEDSLRDFRRDRGEADLPVAPQIVLLAFLKGNHM